MSQAASAMYNAIVTGTRSLHLPEKPIVNAILRRTGTNNNNTIEEEEEEARFARERDTRQEFRRLIEPGMTRGNSLATVEQTLKVLSTIANNLLNDIENEKYRRFKSTNTMIMKHLVEVKGGIEYAVALGFRAKVEQFQPYYIFLDTPKNRDDLRIGAAILKEALDRIVNKAEQERVNREDPKVLQQAIVKQVKEAYNKDREAKKRRDEIEKRARGANTKIAASIPRKRGNIKGYADLVE